ncbi:MAG: hypothetical protein GXZ11_04525, partial [Tissierellia bacterium]|nr:hypothetical protein [Tissierellia bacterium]
MKKQNYGLKSKLLAMVLVIMLCLTAVPMDTFASLVTTEVKNEDTLKPEESIIDESNNSNESAVGEVGEGEIEAPEDGEVITPPEASPKKIAPIAKIKFVGFEGFSENLEFMPITIILMANGVEIERKAFVLNQEELIFSEQIELDEENNLIEYIFALDENQAKQDGVTVDVTGDTIVVKYEKPADENNLREKPGEEEYEEYIPDNPDGLPYPMELEGSGFFYEPGIFDSEIVRYRAFTMERGSGTMGADGPIIGTNHPTTPGEVMLFKQVQEVPGLLNTFEVTLRMEALNNQESNDIVLVI